MPVFVKPLSKVDRIALWRIVRAMCLHGQCYPFAIVLHRAFGWPMLGLLKEYPEFLHVVVRQPDDRFRDARGLVARHDIGLPFGLHPPFELKETNEDELRRMMPSISDELLQSLERKIRAVWPALPWPTIPDRAADFLNDLEAISRKHGIWIRSCVPGARPFLSMADGSEQGYLAESVGLGPDFVFDRAFRADHPTPPDDPAELTEDDENELMSDNFDL